MVANLGLGYLSNYELKITNRRSALANYEKKNTYE